MSAGCIGWEYFVQQAETGEDWFASWSRAQAHQESRAKKQLNYCLSCSSQIISGLRYDDRLNQPRNVAKRYT